MKIIIENPKGNIARNKILAVVKDALEAQGHYINGEIDGNFTIPDVLHMTYVGLGVDITILILGPVTHFLPCLLHGLQEIGYSPTAILG